jgi:dolichol-phosphate mannosyltransferase
MYDWLIVPVYNEENRIKEFLYESDKYDIDFVFVVDGTDKTLDILRTHMYLQLANKKRAISIITSDKRLGKGGAIKLGLKYIHDTTPAVTRGYPPCVGYIDVDLSTQITELIKMFDSLKNSKCDAIIGTRWAHGSLIITPQPILRRIMSRILNKIVRVYFGLDVTDTQCGAKVFRLLQFYTATEEVVTTGFEFDVELLWRMKQHGYTICEFPVIWRNYTKDSKVKITCAFGMLKNLLKLKL